LTHHDSFEQGVNKLCTQLQKQFIKIFEKNYVKDPTNYTLLGLGANKLHGFKFVDQSWLFGLMV
jgi:hypothetical protein